MEVLTVKEASKIMNVSEQYLRDLIRFQLIDVGIAVKIPGNQNYHYIVFKEKLTKLMKGEE